MQTYETVSETLEALRKEGFTRDYNLMENALKCQQDGIELSPKQFDIVQVHRFEGMTDPGDETVVYAIEEQGGKRGTFINAYGPYSDPLSDDMLSKLSVR
jgi:hypothetical protein